MGKVGTQLEGFHRVLAGVDPTYAELPPNAQLLIDKITQGLAEFGPRPLRRVGPGMEFYQGRDFILNVDDPRRINARLSARAGRDIVKENEAEIRQHIFLWRDATPSMNYASTKGALTKKEASELMLLAFAKHLAKNEEAIGLLDEKGIHRGGNVVDALSQQLMSVAIATGDTPLLQRRLPRNSTIVQFSDFLVKPEIFARNIDRLVMQEANGYCVMVLDPQELDFTFNGNRGSAEFIGLEGEAKKVFRKVSSIRAKYQAAMQAHIHALEEISTTRNVKFILQRTDEPLHKALLSIYGLTPVAQISKPLPSL